VPLFGCGEESSSALNPQQGERVELFLMLFMAFPGVTREAQFFWRSVEMTGFCD
jgi:hypothetical protein